jgi:hypothetical protein
MNIIQVLVDAAVPSEDGIVIKWDFKPGSVERSIDEILAGPVGPVGPAGPQYVLFNCRWSIKITVKIRAFFEKMAGGTPETKFCNFKIFF